MRCHQKAVEQSCARAVSVHVRHASVEVQVQCVNVVIGVVLGELHVVRVVPVVVCDDAVVRRTLVLIAFTVTIVFMFYVNFRSHFTKDFAVLEVKCLQSVLFTQNSSNQTGVLHSELRTKS